MPDAEFSDRILLKDVYSMLAYLGPLLYKNAEGLSVAYLPKIADESAWRSGRLVGIDAQGACFLDSEDRVECLPWGVDHRHPPEPSRL